MNARADALLALGRLLQAQHYRFVSVTPSTHARVRRRLARARTGGSVVTTLRDVFGWSTPFEGGSLPARVLWALRDADALEEADGGLLRSRVRFSTLGEDLFVHSAYPTTEKDAVFFGPDTYRFCAAIERWLQAEGRVYERMADIGCGSGVGGIVARKYAHETILTDVNERALAYAEVNAALARTTATCLRSDVLSGVEGPIDAVIANPPYLLDDKGRTYRDGGGRYGEGLSVRIADEALSRLQPGGVLLLYTGTAVADGVDVFRARLLPLIEKRCAELDYEEIDPDVFGEELEHSSYDEVERIAAVAFRAVKA